MGSDYGYEFDNFEAETVDSVEKKKKKQNRFIRCMGSDYGFEFENFKADKTKKNKKKTDLDETNSLEHSKPSNSVSDGKKEQENNENTSPSTNTNCNQMVCNGDLASYTRKQPVPTTTDEYLKEKKINIVRIDYVTTKDTTKCYQSQNSKCIANDQFSNIPKVSLLTNTSPIKFAPELTSIEECKSASSQKSTSNQSTDILNKNKQDMKRSEESKSDNFLNDPPQTSTANETHVTQFENVMVVNGKKSAQQCDFEFSLETDKNSQIKKGSTPAAKECRIIDSLNQNPAEHSKDPKVSKERSGIVSEGTELNISSVNNNAQTLTMDVNTPKNKEWSYKEISPLSETLLAGFTSSVLESTQSIAVDDIYVKSPSVSGCHWLQSENKSPKPKHKELSGVGQILENLRSVSNDEPQDPFNVDAFVTLRKRKRSRHRSKKNRFELDKSLTLTPKTEPIPKLMITEVSPSIHIKFDEDGKEDLMNSKSGNQKCPVAGDNTNDGSHLEPYFEMIQKATPMKDMVPKVGDTIAFKVLKMSENYTPEVSAYIIGNVMKYNPSHGLIKFNIKAGLEELKQPNGKLSIVEDDVKEGQYKEYLWTDLIEPRLFS
ncbi:unnamed protein product [Callosobruchus maculatus]|nr:unnamed protein product [Callosobruchus maculatus]